MKREKEFEPYSNIDIYDEYFEDSYLNYLEKYQNNLNINKIIVSKNDDKIQSLLNQYLKGDINIVSLKEQVEKVKAIILIGEPGNKTKKHIQKINQLVAETIDKTSRLSGIDKSLNEKFESLIANFKPNNDNFFTETNKLKENIDLLCTMYEQNFSQKFASRQVKNINSKTKKTIDNYAIKLGITNGSEENIMSLIREYNNIVFTDQTHFEQETINYRHKINNLVEGMKSKYSNEIVIKTTIKKLKIFDDLVLSNSKKYDYASVLSKKISEINKIHQDNVATITTISNDLERRKAYENHLRSFKGLIREYNNAIRELYGQKIGNKMIEKVILKSDKFTNELAQKANVHVPKNSWVVRRNLWTDSQSFITDKGVKIRQIINKPLRFVVKLAMKNKLIIEEKQELNPNKQYIFVSTHYFTEDVIGLFVGLDRQTYMLMGTTDQIENNPLMLAANLFGFFHVDRLDSADRQDCVNKQNAILDKHSNFINYVSGSWENSENELQPLSFSGPYRSAIAKNVEIVPVASYLVREEKKMYMRFGKPLNVSSLTDAEANEIIRDTLAGMHYKQLAKYSHIIGSQVVRDGTKHAIVHDLPYDQHKYYVEQVGYEYWNQPWTKPFAEEEIGFRKPKNTKIDEAYSFIDNLSRDNLIKLSGILKEEIKIIEEHQRYDTIKYLDNHYDMFKTKTKKKKR